MGKIKVLIFIYLVKAKGLFYRNLQEKKEGQIYFHHTSKRKIDEVKIIIKKKFPILQLIKAAGKDDTEEF